MPNLVVGSKAIECKTVVFDKNGTLVNQHLILLELARARKDSVQRHAGEEVADFWEKIVGVDLRNGKIDQGGPLATAPRREEVLIAAAAFYLKGNSWDDARRMAQEAYDDADASLKPPYGSVLLEGVPDALKQLKKHGLKLAIASTDTHKRTLESFKALGIASLFNVIIGSDDVVNGKPSPDMVFEVLKKIECRADETVVVGDSKSDMLMGRNAKVRACIGVLTGFSSREEFVKLADVIIASVADLRVR